MLYDGATAHVLSGPRIDTMNTHGTGCTTASAIAAELAKGASVLSAARAAKTYVSEALQSSATLQIGSGSQRPFNHGCAVSCPAWCWRFFVGSGIYKQTVSTKSLLPACSGC